MKSAYPPSQLSQWEHYVGLPLKYQHTSNPPLTIEYLTALHVHQIAAVPYENLDLHYSHHKSISLDPQVQFNKIVTEGRGRGGYCMEGNLLYNQILRAAGFEAYTAGVRIRARVDGVPQGDYTGWVHVVNIVTLPNTTIKYVSDVAFGGDGPTLPIPLIDGHIQHNLGTQEVRLIHSVLPHATTRTPNDTYWMYQYRNSPEMEWNSFYAFTEMEFFMNDFVGMNFYTSTFRGGSNFQTERVLVVRFLKGRKSEGNGEGTNGRPEGKEGEEERIVGKVMLVDGVVKRNDGGRTTVVKVYKNEEERIEALMEDFAIKLVKEEIEGIRGYRTELTVKS